MTTGNQHQHRMTFANLPAGTTYFGPNVTGAVVQTYWAGAADAKYAFVDMDGFDHLSIQFSLTAGADNSVTLTVESDDGVSLMFTWDETLGAYDSTTNTYNASYVCAATTLLGHLHLDDANGKLFHVKLVVVNGGNLSNSGIVTIRRTKV
jgi:hypothetical protein